MAKRRGPLGHPTQYEIVKARRNVGDHLDLGDGKQLNLAKIGPTIVKDHGVAMAVEQKYGRDKRGARSGDVLVIPVDNNHRHEDPHGLTHWTFTVPTLPWAKYDELGRRIKEKE